MDSLGKVIAAILIAFMLFINPIQYLYEIGQMHSDSYVEAKSTEFTDHVCSTGSFSVEDYETLKSDLLLSGTYYEIQMEHSKKVFGSTTETSQEKSVIHLLATASPNHVHTQDCYAYISDANQFVSHTCGSQEIRVIKKWRVSESYIICKDCGKILYKIVSGSGGSSCSDRYFTLYTGFPSVYGKGEAYALTTLCSSKCYMNPNPIQDSIRHSIYTYIGTYHPSNFVSFGNSESFGLDQYDYTYYDTTFSQFISELASYGYSYADTQYIPYSCPFISNVNYSGETGILSNSFKVIQFDVNRMNDNTSKLDVKAYYLTGSNNMVMHLYYKSTYGYSSEQTESIILETDDYNSFYTILKNAIAPTLQSEAVNLPGIGDYSPWATRLLALLEQYGFHGVLLTDSPYSSYLNTRVEEGGTDLYGDFFVNQDLVNAPYTPLGIKTLVCDQIVTSIQAQSPVQSIKKGESINQKAILSYKNGGTEVIDCTTTFTSSTVANGQTATLYYNGYANALDVVRNSKTTFSCKVTVNVVPNKQLSSIHANLSKTTIEKTEGFPMESATLYYSDSSTKIVTSGWTIRGFDNTKKGIQNVTISYTEDGITKSTVVQITVENLKTLCEYCETMYYLDDNNTDQGCPYCSITIDHIELDREFVKLHQGDDFNVGVKAVYKNGSKKAVTSWTSNFDSKRLGMQNVIISYLVFKAPLLVQVVGTSICSVCNNEYELNIDGSDPGCPNCIDSIVSIEAEPTNVIVEYGQELDITVYATFINGMRKQVIGWTSNYNSYDIGTQMVTIEYSGKMTTVSVEVIKGEYMVQCIICGKIYNSSIDRSGCPYCNIEISAISASLVHGGTYVQLGSELMLKIVVQYKDNHREMAYSGYTVTGYDSKKLGKQDVEVHYKGHQCNLLIEVVNGLLKTACSKGHVYYLNDDGSDPGCPYCSDIHSSVTMSYLKVTYTAQILENLYVNGVYTIPSGEYFTLILVPQNIRSGIHNVSILHCNLLSPTKIYSYGGQIE